ncbi:MAG: type IV secretory system conjugative DNA transfer family protein, partial [Planctomycetales bacterium]|nr:type IV secretory system conjugative DNA transfer family protein [Planctomycetales bacterium]
SVQQAIISLPPQIPHVAVFGSSGSGKSSCFANVWLMTCSDCMVTLDAKAELAMKTARLRATRFGHKVIVIDPFGISNGCGFEPMSYNPLDCYHGQEERIVDEARRMANALVVRTGEERDRFWNDSSVVVITLVLAFLMSEANREDANLNRLRDIVTSPHLMEQLLQYCEKSDACFGMLARMAGQVRFFQGQTGASIFSVVNSHLSFLDSMSIAQCLAESNFDPRELLNGKVSIYLCLPIDRVTEMAALQRILLSSLLNLVFEGGEQRDRQTRFILDEAATLGEMDALYNSLNFGRSFSIRLAFLFQSVSQIQRCFPESKAADFKGTVASVFCGVNDLETAKEVFSYWAERSGDSDCSSDLLRTEN